MVKNNICRIIIAKSNDTPLGIVTEKDIVLYLYAHADAESLDNIILEKIMTGESRYCKRAKKYSGVCFVNASA